MNMNIYKDAITELAVPKLTAFLKAQADLIEIDGWAKLRAPEKRENMLEGLKLSKELREQFVAFYADDTGKEADFSEWEIAIADEADAPAVEEEAPAEDAPTPTPETATAVAEVTMQAPTAFVEGAFEQIVADVAGLDAQQSKVNLLEAEDRMEFEHIRIGALLAHIQTSQHYQTLGYDNVREFLAAETALDYRKGVYLISNYNKVRELGLKADDLKGVTWSALRHIVPILNTKNAKKWLDAARSTTQTKLIEQVYKEKAKQEGALPKPETADAPTEEVKPISKVFNITPDQNVTVSAAIEKAKNSANVDSAGAALEIIAASYSGAPVSDDTIALGKPDTSEAGLKAMFSKLAAQGGIDALIPILNAIGEVWPDVEITVAMPSDTTTATAAE